MSSDPTPREFIRELFLDVFGAATETQQNLSKTDPLTPPTRVYLPRVAVDFEFQIEERSGGKVLFVFPKKRKLATQRHHFRFCLESSPDPPAPPSSPTGRPALALEEPPFLIPKRGASPPDSWDGDTLTAILIEALERDPESPRVRYEFGAQRPNVKKIGKEVEALEEARKDQDLERGLVFFRLHTEPESFLVVRVDKKSKKDGLFVVTPRGPGGAPKIDVYSFRGDGVKDVDYRPLHALSLAVRRWLEGASPAQREAPPGFQARYGVPLLQELSELIQEGYGDAMRYLAAHPIDIQEGEEAWFDLTDVEAEFAYSIEFGANAGINFAGRRAPDGGAGGTEFEFIQSRALISVQRTEGRADLALRLLAPEFVLSGDARRRFLKLVREQADELGAELVANRGGRPSADYAKHLANSRLAKRAVVFLAYKQRRPDNQFLVVWPGPDQTAPRDFVFSCKLAGERLKLTGVVMTLDESVQRMVGAGEEAADDELSGKEYKAFHNFFHAVRMWESRSRR